MVLCQQVKNIWQSDLVVRKHWTAHINLAQRKTYNINLYRDRIHPSHERLAQRKTYNINLYRDRIHPSHERLAQRKTYNINLYRDRIHPSQERLAQRKTYNINLYRDRIHPSHTLAQNWLTRISIQIQADCWQQQGFLLYQPVVSIGFLC